MNKENKILLSGIKPTGTIHVGNYFGAMKQFIDLQDKYESYIFIADYHALTSVTNKELLRKQTFDVAVDYLAAGLNPEKVTLFLQSDIPEVTELAWIFNCITTVPYLQRAHAYKDAQAKDAEINVGVFDYPILMAADILIADADIVPVGKDQKQHIEYARDTALKFNRLYGANTFKMPESLIMDGVDVVPGTDGRKMSKSYGNVIPLYATYEEIKKAVMSVPTDSKSVEESKDPEECKVYALHKLFAGDNLQAVAKRYTDGGMGYKESKDILTESIENFISPMRERRKKIANDEEYVYSVLKKGGEKAKERVTKKMEEVRKVVGLS